MTYPLLLRWVLLHSILIAGSVLGILAAPGRIHGAALVAIPLISGLYASGALLAGYLLYLVNKWQLPYQKELLRHRADLLVDIADECQYAGMLCMIAGFYVILSAHFSGNADLLSKVTEGAPLALSGTFVGVLGSRLLALQHRWIVRRLP